MDIACTTGGSISGEVTGVSKEWAGHAWVIAFTKNEIQAEAQVDANGHFTLEKLPPGEYGLKVGYDAFHDPEVPGDHSNDDDYKKLVEPWKHASPVTLAEGAHVRGVHLEMPHR